MPPELKIWAMVADKDLYMYRAYSKHRIALRMGPAIDGFDEAGIEPIGDWVDPIYYPEVRLRMVQRMGAKRFHETWRRTALERFCFICGHDLTGAMGCTAFIFDKPRNQKASLGFETIPGDPLICVLCYKDRGSNLFYPLEYRRLMH